MTRFPLLKLPFLAIETVLKQVDFADLIDFTTCSKKCQMTVSQMKHPYTRMEINITKNEKCVKIFSDFKWVLKWTFNPFSTCQRARVRKIDKIRIRWLKQPGEWYLFQTNIFSKHSRAEFSMQLIITYLIRLFRIPITKVLIFTDGVDQFPFQFSCESLDIRGNSGTISAEDLKFSLENVKATRNLYVHLNTVNGFISEPSIDCDEIKVEYGNWTGREFLLNSKFARADLHYCNFSNQDVIDFIRNWLNSTDKRLEMLKIWLINGVFDENLFRQQLTTVVWSSAKRGRDFKFSSEECINFSKAMDIERSDGLLASCLISGNFLDFGVWHDRFPETDGLRVW